jgi:lysophospholipase L1-like esterase
MSTWAPFAAGLLLLTFIGSTPFWAMAMNTRSSGDASVSPVFSYSEAKANPAAFSAWWKFFVDEVVRTNEIVFEPDVAGHRDAQGKLPRRPKPGARTRFYQGEISINSLGYRGDEFLHAKGDVFRILTIGDSTTFGQTLFRDSRTWSMVLQDLIARDLTCRLPVRVVNGGVNGFHLRNGIDRIEWDYSWLRPDMVLSYFGWNSMADLGVYPTGPDPTDVPPTAGNFERVGWYLRQAATSFYNKITTDFQRLTMRSSNQSSDEDLLKVARQGLLYQQYQQLIEQSRRLKYELVLLSFNTAVVPEGPEASKDFYQGPWPGVRSIIKQVELHNVMIHELAAATQDVHFVDTSDHLLGRYDKDLYLDVVHFTTRGDALMAENVYHGLRPLLLEEKALGCRPTSLVRK